MIPFLLPRFWLDVCSACLSEDGDDTLVLPRHPAPRLLRSVRFSGEEALKGQWKEPSLDSGAAAVQEACSSSWTTPASLHLVSSCTALAQLWNGNSNSSVPLLLFFGIIKMRRKFLALLIYMPF